MQKWLFEESAFAWDDEILNTTKNSILDKKVKHEKNNCLILTKIIALFPLFQ